MHALKSLDNELQFLQFVKHKSCKKINFIYKIACIWSKLKFYMHFNWPKISSPQESCIESQFLKGGLQWYNDNLALYDYNCIRVNQPHSCSYLQIHTTNQPHIIIAIILYTYMILYSIYLYGWIYSFNNSTNCK